MNLKEIFNKFPDDTFTVADGLDDAVIGVYEERPMRLVYDVYKCAEILMERDGMEYGEAIEFLEFNSISAYVGEQTPVWVYYEEGEEGFEEGQLCNRDGCLGVIELREKEGCLCFESCGGATCTTPTDYCPKCEWQND
jgi:hypothetical protein